MRIIIKTEGRRFFIPVPLYLSGVGVRAAMRFAVKEQLSKEQKKSILQCCKVIKKSLKGYKGLHLVDVQSADGDEVKIIV